MSEWWTTKTRRDRELIAAMAALWGIYSVIIVRRIQLK
jgi:hypothetical protein